jgi:hypothetical protein
MFASFWLQKKTKTIIVSKDTEATKKSKFNPTQKLKLNQSLQLEFQK